MLSRFETVKGVAATAAAFIFCPCHLPLTLPLVLALTGGTTAGVWIAGNVGLITLVLSVVFAVFLFFAAKWVLDVLKVKPADEACVTCNPKFSLSTPEEK